MDIIIFYGNWRCISNIKKMSKKSKIYFILIIFISIVVFFSLLIGLNKENTYYPNAKNRLLDKEIVAKDLLLNKKVNFENIIKSNNYTIINIWSSWCVPCRSEHKFLMNLSNNTKINIIGLNYKDNENNAQNFLNELGNPFDFVLVDEDGLISIDLGAYGVPETFIINNQEKLIVKRYIGPIDKQILDEIKKIVN